jgi:regulator of nucleoside diphosphate kinase
VDTHQVPVITELDALPVRDLGSNEARIVPGRRVPPGVVTLNSIVSFRDEATQTVHKVTLVHPQDKSIGGRRISALSPVGRALLGQLVGSVSRVEFPEGTLREMRILELAYQPEEAPMGRPAGG